MKLGTATPRELLLGLALAAAGALPLAVGPPEPVALLVWLAVWAPAAGALAGGLGVRLWPAGLAVPAAWMILVTLVDAASERDLPTPVWAALAWTGLFALGLGAGAVAPRAPLRRAALVLALAGLLAAAPAGGGRLARPWPPEVSARLLDLAPPTVIAECAGVDWMRHPAVYAPVGTARLDPSLRTAFRGALAGPVLLVVGFGAALAVRAGRRRGTRSP